VTSNAAVTGTSASSASGFLVQVAAYQREGEADAVRARLVSKGYPAFVTSASTTAGTFYRVRVGGYDKEADARSVAARLKREEHLEPWVTR
jgi:DedD protein